MRVYRGTYTPLESDKKRMGSLLARTADSGAGDQGSSPRQYN